MSRIPMGESAARSKYYEAKWGERPLLVAIQQDFHAFLRTSLSNAAILDRCERIAHAKAEAGVFQGSGLIYLTVKDL